MRRWFSDLKIAFRRSKRDICVMLGVVALIYGFAFAFGIIGVACVVGYFLVSILRSNWD